MGTSRWVRPLLCVGVETHRGGACLQRAAAAAACSLEYGLEPRVAGGGVISTLLLMVALTLLLAPTDLHPSPPLPPALQTENVLLTSWSWVFLSDYAPFKPTFLPADNPVGATAAMLSPPAQRGGG